MNKFNVLCLVGLCAGWLACQSSTQTPTATTTPFFDLKAHLTAAAKQLDSVKMIEKKVAVGDSLGETKQVAVTDWTQELADFFNSDINRPAWTNKYKVEKTAVDSSSYLYPTVDSIFYYKALDNDLKTREMTVMVGKNGQFSVDIINVYKSPMIESVQDLRFGPMGYSIKTTQKMAYQPDKVLTISANFQPVNN